MKPIHLSNPFFRKVCFVGLLLLLGCEKKHSPVENPLPGEQPAYIGFSGDTCIGSGMAKPGGENAFLEQHAFSGDTLSLVFRYVANCCP